MSELEKKELPPEFIEFIQDGMKATSRKPDKVPRKLYHATKASNLSSILENGLKPHEIFGEIYFCEKERQCLKFIPRAVIIFCIDTTKLDQDKFYLGNDHVKFQNRNFDTYTYYGHISPELCTRWRRV